MKYFEQRDTLAESKRSRVEICNNDIVHIQSGNITVHLSIKDFKDLTFVLSDALKKIDHLSEDTEQKLMLIYNSEEQSEQ